MALLVSDVLTEARVLLNDVAAATYNDTTLLPFFKKAYRELQNEIQTINGSRVKEIVGPAMVAALATIYPSPPADLLYPITLMERAQGSSDIYTPMTETAWEPNEQQTTLLRFWNWREGEIKFLGATANRDVLLRYLKGLPAITAVGNSVLTGDDSITFLAARTAALAAYFVGQNESRASALQEDANKWLLTYKNTTVKRTQAVPRRRRPWGSRLRRWI